MDVRTLYPMRSSPSHGIPPLRNRPSVVFITVCTKNRESWLASRDVHSTLKHVWREATAWLVGRYVLMPDHIHLFAAIADTDISLDNWTRFWKSQFTKRHGDASHRWQSGYWDTWLRSADSYDMKWEYVRANPVRHGLVENADDWEFQGVIADLVW